MKSIRAGFQPKPKDGNQRGSDLVELAASGEMQFYGACGIEGDILRLLAVLLALKISAAPARALDDASADYITSNTIAIFYHELGHALIDILRVPVLGQEEDAADVLSILLIDQLFESEEADLIALDSAFSYRLDAEKAGVYDLPYWDTHGLDLQRFYTLVCLHYGADTTARTEFAEALELPEERAASCEDERGLAEESWNIYLDAVDNENKSDNWVIFEQEKDPANEAQQLYVEQIFEEVEALNNWLDLDERLYVRIEECGEANAFYDPNEATIIMCLEFADFLAVQSDG